jgi:poly(A) polymerase
MSTVNKVTNPLLDALPATHARIVDRLAHVFAEHGRELVLVGGIVRDWLLGESLPTDLDFATNARPEETERLGMKAGAASVYLVGARFGTVGLVFADESSDGPPVNVEITTYRAEHYPNETRKPEVAFGDTLEDDLSRRDFTVNAIAVDTVTGAIIDPFDGQADLARSIIRAVGDPETRFQEDPLRLLRAARFVSQLGFLVEPETAAAMERQAPSLARISRERIYAELTRLLTGPYASHGLETLHRTGLFTVALPEIAYLPEQSPTPGVPHREKDLWTHTKRVVERCPPRPVVRWAALLHDAAKPQTRSISNTGEIHFFGHEREGAEIARRMLARLNADRATQAAVRLVVELHGRPETYDDTWTDSAVRRLMVDAGDHLPDLLDLAASDVTSARPERQRAARDRIGLLRAHIARLEQERALAEYQSPLDGTELMALFDRPPGRWIAEVKDQLRELVLDGDLEPGDKDRATEIAREIVAGLA